MKHAGPEALATLQGFLSELRKREPLQEKRPGVFYLKSRAFLHFHEDPRGLFADDFSRFPVNTPRRQEQLAARIDRALAGR